jgi:predicted secreted protein
VHDLSSRPINPVAVLKGLIHRQLLRLLDDPNSQDKLEKLRETLKWDYKVEKKSQKIVNSVNAKWWDYYKSRGHKSEIGLLIRQKISESLSAQIAQETVWVLLSESNNRLKMTSETTTDDNLSQLLKENENLAQELTRELKTKENEGFNNTASEIVNKSTELAKIPESVSNLGERLSSFRKGFDNIALDISHKNTEIVSEVTSLADNLQMTKENIPDSILHLITKSKDIAYNTGLSLGFNFGKLEPSVCNKVCEIAEKDLSFSSGLGVALGFTFNSLSKDSEERILQMADVNPHFSFAFGNSLSRGYAHLDKDKRQRITELAERNSLFARALGGDVFKYLENQVHSKVTYRKIEVSNLPFSLDTDIGFLFKPQEILKPQERPIVKHGNYRIHVEGEINVPEVTLEIVELDIISIKLDSISIKLSLSNSQTGALGRTTVSGHIPWRMKYDIINSLEGIKNPDFISKNRVEIKPKNTSKYVGNGRFECLLYLAARPEVLDEIDYVTYILHPTFEEAIHEVYDSKSGFSIALSVWGEFRIHIKVNYKDGNIDLLSHMLRLEPETVLTVKRGEKFKIELESNRSTGYGWHLAHFNNSILKHISSEFVPKIPNQIGKTGIEQFNFEAAREGTTGIRLVYRRAEEREAIKSNDIFVNVI